MRVAHVFWMLCVSINLSAQVGGESTFNFLSVPSSARAQYLGRAAMSYNDGDISLMLSNPALLSASMEKKILVSTNFLFGNSFNTVGYVTSFKKTGTMGFAAQGNTYGSFPMTDINGTVIGTISPLDLNLQAIYQKSIGPYSVGVSGKMIYSKLDNTSSSYGCGIDISFSGTDSAKSMCYSFMIKNLGAQILPYHSTAEAFPFDIHFGFSQRLKHLPLRFGILLHDLYRWDITYDDPALFKTNTLNNAAVAVGKYGFVDNLFRHITLSAEVYFGKAFRIGLGYDHQRRTELAYESALGLAGMSMGFNITARKFDVGYSLAKYSVVGASHQFTMVVKLNQSFQKKS